MQKALMFVLGLAAGLLLFPVPADATDFDPWRMTFPVDGENRYGDTYYACRGGSGCPRLHYATDLMADKMTPVVAAWDGVIGWFKDGDNCCHMQIKHDGGWATTYIHLNNDTPGTDDGQGEGIAPGLGRGVEVKAGQLIGWVGDSGNAENTAPHLHFEIWDGNTRINPYRYLLEAEKRISYAGRFYDDEGSKHEANIDRFYQEDITRGCNPPYNDKYCPDGIVSRGEMAAFIRRMLDLPASATDWFDDDDGDIFEGDINAIMEAGIGFGCTDTAYCSGDPLPREEFAELFTRVFGYTNPGGENWFTDDEDSRFEESINALRAADVTRGCNPPDNDRFCPYLPVDRAAMASFFVRALPDL